MIPAPLRRPALAALIALAALASLYAGAITTGFLNDDHLFLEQARTQTLAESLGRPDPLGNYFRPLSRQLYFAALAPVAGGDPLVFHLANAALFVVALALLADLLLALVPPAAAAAGLLYFALLPLQRVNLTWISCSQDLLALALTLGAFALWRRGRTRAPLALYALALASKESAAALPLAIAAWSRLVDGRPLRAAVRAAAPFAVVALAWGAATLAVRAAQGSHAAPLRFHPLQFLAGLVHGVQSLLGLEDPAGMAGALFASPPDPVAALLLAALAPLIVAPRPAGASAPAGRVAPGAALRFALVWLGGFALVTGPVAHIWSGYFYTLAAVGGAALVGLALRRIDRLGWVMLALALTWWHAGARAAPGIGVTADPWGMTSHLTARYFERGAALTARLADELVRLEPDPAPETRFFFATLPPYAGFQMGNGALIRSLYDDPSLASHFYSRFSDSTAAGHPCRFLYWDGAGLAPLYGNAADPWFQIGTDLLLLDRLEGARHAFRRGLDAGGEVHDHLYWLGWTELWLGERAAAERAWAAFGARDDSLQWHAHMWVANRVLFHHRDTLETRRLLLGAIRARIGHPAAHATLGQLLAAERPKYAALELKVAAFLAPRDWLAHRDLAAVLAEARLDDQAREAMDRLRAIYPEWRADSIAAAVEATLAARAAPAGGRVELRGPVAPARATPTPSQEPS